MIEVLKKYFIPNEHNEYKPHILRKTAVGVIAFVSVMIFFAGVAQNVVLIKTSLLSAVIPRALVDLANGSRFANNVGVLSTNPTLEFAAQLKANDMAGKGYFAHVSPEGVEPWHWIRQAGYQYVYAGENLAVNFSDSVDVNNAWLNSPTHRANILNDRFTEVGIATARGMYKGRETVFVVQMFGRPMNPATVAVVAQRAETPVPVVAFLDEEPETPVLGASGLSVLGDETVEIPEEIFVSTINPALEDHEIEEALLDTPVVVSLESQSSVPDKIATSPKTMMNIIYMLLGAFILISLLLTIFIEIKKQHPKHIIYGVALIALFFVLGFVYRTFIFTEVIVL